jgi:OmpA-OmpF porin, OOP family
MRSFLAGMLLSCCAAAFAATMPVPPAASTAASDTAGAPPVIVSGTVPDDATKVAVLQKLDNLYGASRIVDHLAVGGVVTPANWGHFVAGMIGPDLKQVSRGQVSVHGDAITIRGDVPDEAVRQQVLSSLSQSFDSHYAITQSLKVVQSKQAALDQTLANRTIQFESGSAVLTPQGMQILDQMAATIRKLDNPFIQIIGNTDDVGNRTANIQLSLMRAEAVKTYLVGKGVPAANLSVSGQGPDNPVASNDTEAGRARNRRIDFKIYRQ